MKNNDRRKDSRQYVIIAIVIILASIWQAIVVNGMIHTYPVSLLVYYGFFVSAIWFGYTFLMAPFIIEFSRRTWLRRITGVVLFGTCSYLLLLFLALIFRDVVPEAMLLYTEWQYILPLFYFYEAVKLYIVNQISSFEIANTLERRSELLNLQTRIYPHFLFNALNNIAAMMHSNPDKAEDSLLNLADVMRASISTPDRLVPLMDEVSLSLKYAEVESLRWQNMYFEANIPEDCRDFPIPSLIIQPLIENAVYHGVSKRSDGGVVTINAVRDDDGWIHVKVANPLPNTDSSSKTHRGNGFALESVEKRLKLLYEKASFESGIINDEFIATISFKGDSYSNILSVQGAQSESS